MDYMAEGKFLFQWMNGRICLPVSGYESQSRTKEDEVMTDFDKTMEIANRFKNSDLVFTRNGKEVEDQVAALKEFKEQAEKSEPLWKPIAKLAIDTRTWNLFGYEEKYPYIYEDDPDGVEILGIDFSGELGMKIAEEICTTLNKHFGFTDE